MRALRYLRRVMPCGLVLCGMILLGIVPTHGAETIFTDSVRIKVAHLPILFLERTNPDGPRVWRLINGIDLYLEDVTAGTTPFIIDRGALSESIRIRSNGNVGLGTGGASENLHILAPVDDTDAAIRLEVQSPISQRWDLQATSTGFALVDVETRDAPLIVEAGSPENTICLSENGSVGIGTKLPNNTGAVTSPGRYFNLRADGGTAATGISNGVFQGSFGAQNHLVHLNAPVNQKVMRLQCSSGFFGLHVLSDTLATKAVADVLSIKMANGNVGLKVQNPTQPLHLASGAHCTAGGVWTNASSLEQKQNVQPITSEQARDTVRALQPVGYRYKNEPNENYVGFIAEDVPDLVATNDRKSLAPMDIVAVLTKVVQEQDQVNERQQQLIIQQQALLATLSQRLADLEQKVGRAEAQSR